MQVNSIKFIDAANELRAAIEKFHGVVLGIRNEPDYGRLVDEVSATESKVTVLESAVLSLDILKVVRECDNICLIDMVRNFDPKRELIDSFGDSWYALAKDATEGAHVKAIRSMMDVFAKKHVTIREGKIIIDMVQQGLL